MDKKSQNKVSMFRSTETLLVDNMDQLADIPDFQEYFSHFQGNLVRISELDTDLESDTTGTTEEKDDSIELVAKEAYAVSLKLKAFASKVGDKKLLNKISFTRSQLLYASDQTLHSRAKLILKAANKHVEDAAVYGLSQEQIDRLTALFTDFSDRIPDPRQAVIDKKDAGKQLNVLIRATDNLLKEHIDVRMELKGIEDPDLLDRYWSAREIIDRK